MLNALARKVGKMYNNYGENDFSKETDTAKTISATTKTEVNSMPVLYMLIGVPCSGKTTFRHKYFGKSFVHLSTDDIIEEVAKLHQMTYSQSFQMLIGPAQEMVNKLAENAIKAQKPVVWDQTNLTVKGRKSKLDLFRGYYRVGYHFVTPKPVVLETRLNEEYRKNNKIVPPEVIARMAQQLEEPTLDEGFSEVNTFSDG